jgi:hypothetical protein
MGKLDEARENVARVRPFFERISSRRGAGLCAVEIAFGLSALFNLWDNLPGEAFKDLRRSEELSKIIQKPLYNAIHFCIKAVLKERRHPLLEQILVEDTEYYLRQARTLFETLGLPAETGAFLQLKKS